MKDVYAKLLHQGSVLLNRVRVNLRSRPLCKVRGSMQVPWAGDLEVPKGECVQAGEPYELLLRDGRRGDLLFCRSATAYEDPIAVRFVGSGPLESTVAPWI